MKAEAAGERFYSYKRLEFILKWYSELVWTYRLPADAEDEANDVLGKRPLWQTEEEWRRRLSDIDAAWTYLDTVNEGWAMWIWQYFVERRTIDQIARLERCRFSVVQAGLRYGISTMVRFLNGEAR